MPVIDPRDRERLAWIEIGQTAVSAAVARWLTVLFLVTAVGVPLAEVGRELAGTGAGWGWEELLAAPRRALAAAREGGPWAGNRALLAELNGFEDRLDEGSLVAELALPPVQWLLSGGLGVGNEEAYLGRDGWLFYRPDVDHLTGPGFLEASALVARAAAGEAWEARPQPDPRPALLRFAAELRERGIALVVMPTPVKPGLHPEYLAPTGRELPLPLTNPSFAAFVEGLEAAGIGVFDPAPGLAAARAAGGEPLYLATDTHWRPEAVERVAAELAAYLTAGGVLPAAPQREYARRRVTVENLGDVARMLELPGGAQLFPPQRVVLEQVVAPGGGPWRPDPTAAVLLLGDSFTNVYSQGGLGWGEGAGLAEQLSYHLGRGVDRLALNAGGAQASRRRLARGLASGEDRLSGKRVVVYQFAARELSSGDWPAFGIAGAAGAGEAATPGALPRRDLGDGFVVWESKRTGAWRIWTRRLDGSGLRQLSPDEPGRQHCCPHISPDGESVVYLSRTVGEDTYPEKEVPGRLHLVPAAGGAGRVVAEAARTYGWGNRSAVWRNERELIHVGGDGRTVLVDVGSGRARPLTAQPRAELGWLIDPTLSWAVTAAPNFSPYDAATRQVAERQPFAGCEPYFTQDGRFGVWVAGGGGPINRIDLGDRTITTLIARDDPRLSDEKRYMYFPMPSRDARLLAYGASRGAEEHDHFQADYDIFVAPVDPGSLELVGQPVRLTDHPAPDRYPDVFAAPLELGSLRGEAPLTVRFTPSGEGEWEWSWGDGGSGRGEVGRHTYRRAGFYEVTARRGGRVLRGQVAVAPAAPPRVVLAALQADGRAILVRFDEEVDLAAARAELESGTAVIERRAGEDGRSLRLTLAAEPPGGDRLRLTGVSDRAAEPHRMPAEWHAVEPPAWPSARGDLYFLFQTADQPNLAYDPALSLERAFPLAPQGRARTSGDGALLLGPGSWFTAPPEAGENLVQAARDGVALTFEATLMPAAAETPGLAPLITLRSRGGRDEVTLGQQGRHLVLRLRDGGGDGAASDRRVRLFALRPGERVHAVVSYAAGHLNAFRDGEPVLASEAIDTGFAGWRRGRLFFGGEGEGGAEWRGELVGVALYARPLGASEAHENARRFRRFAETRSRGVERLEVRARLVARSSIPTLDEISPYRQALAVYDYEVLEVLAGAVPGRRLRTAHWVILDGERQPIAALQPGRELRLRLEPFAANPQLEGHYLADTLEPTPGRELYYAVEEE